MAPLETSPEHPAPVRTVSQLVARWIDRLGAIWVEGQVAQLTRRPGANTAFLTLRDTAADLSVSVTCKRRVLDGALPPITEGDRVVIYAKPSFYPSRGTFSLAATDIRHVGLGELLARLERLKATLAAEGLFDVDRKRSLPFLPRGIGLICGRSSAAERDVVENARRRWPNVTFHTREVAVQGPTASAAVIEAVRELDAHHAVDVIVITRGGGSVEDLLPFSEEKLIRTVANAATPIVSAIGHEQDSPLLDLVADVRASTPTDAARRVVPDVIAELRTVSAARERMHESMRSRVAREQHLLDQLRSRPVLAAPTSMVDAHEQWLTDLRQRAKRAVTTRLDTASNELIHTRARVRSLSPQATLDRGYALVQSDDGTVVRRAPSPGTRLLVRVAEAQFTAITDEES
ncbi:MAG TPA: exodeoxyribonuclease VII large subunit [Actinomycetes bacterium]|nr:exodeoxyribonuclease VII large subunit [Actinomycetes bacterium]